MSENAEILFTYSFLNLIIYSAIHSKEKSGADVRKGGMRRYFSCKFFESIFLLGRNNRGFYHRDHILHI